jgi:hypothetical protein
MFSLPALQPVRPAAKTASVVALCALYTALGVVAWLSLVPRVFSAQTFAWMSLLVVATTVAAVWSIIGARSTRSIAHVLYDVEHPARSPKL